MMKYISKIEFDEVCKSLWTEIDYQNHLARRTNDEAKDIPGFTTLSRVYLRRLEDKWSDNAGVDDDCLDSLRKLSAIFLRAMVYCGTKNR